MIQACFLHPPPSSNDHHCGVALFLLPCTSSEIETVPTVSYRGESGEVWVWLAEVRALAVFGRG